jgi:hypothetical protein
LSGLQRIVENDANVQDDVNEGETDAEGESGSAE